MLLLFVLEQRDTRSDSFSASSKKQPLNGKNIVFFHCLGKNHNATGQNRLLELFLSLRGGSPGGPRRPQEPPRMLQDHFGSASGRLKSLPETGLGGLVRPSLALLASKRPQEASRRPFWTPEASILDAPGIIFRLSRGQLLGTIRQVRCSSFALELNLIAQNRLPHFALALASLRGIEASQRRNVETSRGKGGALQPSPSRGVEASTRL